MLSYRSSRLAAAQTEAQEHGATGARFPLESGVTGANVCRGSAGSLHEIHTTGDVAMAHVRPPETVLYSERGRVNLMPVCRT